jgi:hypothetical protein
MNYKATIMISLLLLYLSNVSGQKDEKGDKILFRGVVLSASSGERLAGSKFYINKALSGSSRDDGTFSFFAFKHDTIIFDMLGYKATHLIVLDTLKAKEFIAGVYLQSDTIEIGEVVIIPNLSGLKAEMMNPPRLTDQKLDNAVTNLNIASYQGRVSQGKMSDPYSNYDALREQQKVNAYEKGQISSSRIAGINPFMLLPAAYLLLHGLPEKPAPPSQSLSSKELQDLNKKYFEQKKIKK